MKRTSIMVLVVAMGVTALLVAKFRNSRSSSTSVRKPSSSLNGQMAPDFALESLDSRTVHLSDFHGKAVLLNFWATWCTPCKVEMPWFEQMHKQYGPQGLQVVGIAMDDASKKDIAEFASNLGIDYPILVGKESVGEAYGGVQFLPVTVYVGRDGKIVEKVFGLKGRDEIEDNVRKALGRRR
ncbi:MAG TPA: TlpA disulfide reductase family protein [Terriglobales bacterium]|nr:TlpA disulfide reductase family protein [Terriglobales bacterium]